MIKDRILRKRYKLWRERQGNYWKSPLEINEGGYLVVRYGSGSSWINEEETPVLAFPPGCQGEGGRTAEDWQRDQLPPIPNCSSYLLFKALLGGEPSRFLHPEIGIDKSYTVGAGHYVSLVLESNRTLTAYPTPAAFADMEDILAMHPVDASHYMFEDFQGNGWELDFSSHDHCLTEDGIFYPNDQDDEGSYWIYGWSQDNFVYDCLHELLLLEGKATFSYFLNELPNRKSLAQEVADACGLQVITH